MVVSKAHDETSRSTASHDDEATPAPTAEDLQSAKLSVAAAGARRPRVGAAVPRERSGPIGIASGDFSTPSVRRRTITQPRGTPVAGIPLSMPMTTMAEPELAEPQAVERPPAAPSPPPPPASSTTRRHAGRSRRRRHFRAGIERAAADRQPVRCHAGGRRGVRAGGRGGRGSCPRFGSPDPTAGGRRRRPHAATGAEGCCASARIHAGVTGAVGRGDATDSAAGGRLGHRTTPSSDPRPAGGAERRRRGRASGTRDGERRERRVFRFGEPDRSADPACLPARPMSICRGPTSWRSRRAPRRASWPIPRRRRHRLRVPP